MSVDNAESITEDMNEMNWRVNWKEYLKESVLNDKKKCILIMNVDNGEMKGVVKRGEEVIEVKESSSKLAHVTYF